MRDSENPKKQDHLGVKGSHGSGESGQYAVPVRYVVCDVRAKKKVLLFGCCSFQPNENQRWGWISFLNPPLSGFILLRKRIASITNYGVPPFIKEQKRSFVLIAS